jgi:hypothetical protein
VVLTGGGRRIGGKYSKLEISTSDGISSPRMEQESTDSSLKVRWQ